MPDPVGPWQPGRPLSYLDLPNLLGAVRDVDGLRLQRTGTVVATGRRGDPYALRFDPTVDYLFAHYLAEVAAGGAPLTVRKYAYGCLSLVRYAAAFDTDLAVWTRTEVRDMVRHLQQADNPQRLRSANTDTPMPGTMHLATGKRYLEDGYAPRYINGLLVPARGFFEWYSGNGGPVANPVPAAAGQDPTLRSINAGHNPLEPFKRPLKRGILRQRVPEWLPRRIRPEHLDILRADVRTERDIAMFTILEDSAVRSTELITLTDRNLDPGARIIRVIAKGRGGATRDVPCSDDAFTAIDLARKELLRRRRVRVATNQPLFWTLGRRDPKPMDYQSLRSWWRALNARHSFNYTLHDMRHTAAFRMVESGHMTLPQVQEALGHRHLTTTQLYTRPTVAEVVTAAAAWWEDLDRREQSGLDLTAVQNLDADDLAEVFGDML